MVCRDRDKYFATGPRTFPQCILPKRRNSSLELESKLDIAFHKHLICHFEHQKTGSGKGFMQVLWPLSSDSLLNHYHMTQQVSVSLKLFHSSQPVKYFYPMNIRENGSIFTPDLVFFFQVVGRLDLGGPKCTGTALNHWNEVVSSPRRQIAEWHKLSE